MTGSDHDESWDAPITILDYVRSIAGDKDSYSGEEFAARNS